MASCRKKEVLTIPRASQSPIADAPTLALAALGWVLADGPRAERLLALTGLTPDSLRESLNDPGLQAAVLDYLCGHEPDLIAAAEALGVDPGEFSAARARLAP